MSTLFIMDCNTLHFQIVGPKGDEESSQLSLQLKRESIAWTSIDDPLNQVFTLLEANQIQAPEQFILESYPGKLLTESLIVLPEAKSLLRRWQSWSRELCARVVAVFPCIMYCHLPDVVAYKLR